MPDSEIEQLCSLTTTTIGGSKYIPNKNFGFGVR